MKHFHLIKASAGTGKTYQLTTRYIQLLSDGVNPASILATTFTKKAAAEIRERVFLRLSEEILRPQTAAPNRDIPATPLILRNLVRNQHRMLICTMDSLCVQIARMFAAEIGLSDDWSIADPVRQQELIEVGFQSTLAQDSADDASQLIRNILGEEAARSISGRISAHLNDLVATLRHSDCANWGIHVSASPEILPNDLIAILRQVPLPTTQKGSVEKRWATARDRLIINLAAAAWHTVVADSWVNKVSSGEKFNRKECSPETQQAVRTALKLAVHQCLSELNTRTRHLADFTARLHHTYLQEIVSSQTLGFQDVKYLLSVLFSSHEDLAEMLTDVFYRLDTKIQHVLLDEFQDTSLEEWRVLDPLVEEILGQVDQRTFLCVGDIKQAIYGWRGGRSELLDQMPSRWPQLHTSTMVECRRCSRQVLSVVNQVFSALEDSEIKQQFPDGTDSWIRNFGAHTAQNDRQGFAALLQVPLPSSDQDEINRSCYQKAAHLCKKINEQCPSAKIGILVRTNRAARACAELLKLHYPDLVFTLEGGELLTNNSAVRCVLSALMLYRRPNEALYRFTVATSPLGTHLALFDWNDISQIARARQKISQQITERGLKNTIASLIQLVIRDCSAEDHRACHKLLQLAERSKDISISLLMRLAETTRIPSNQETQVQIMTIHNSKGLEFDAVLLPDLNQQLVPVLKGSFIQSISPSPWEGPQQVVKTSRKALIQHSPQLRLLDDKTNNQTLYESLSVLYVALTRAKYALYMIVPEEARKNTYAHLLNELLEPSSTESLPFDWIAEVPQPIHQLQQRKPPNILKACLDFKGHNQNVVTPTEQNHPSEFRFIKSTESMHHGEIVHQQLATLAWVSDKSELSDLLLPYAETLLPILNRSRYSLENGEVLEVWHERDFVYLDDSKRIIRGRWDRVVLTRKAQEIVGAECFEFKTGKRTDHLAQSQYYQAALQKICSKGAKVTYSTVYLAT